MPVVHAKIQVDVDGSISGKAPREIPPCEYEAPIEVAEQKPGPKRKRLNLPSHDCGPWDDSVSLRREDNLRRRRTWSLHVHRCHEDFRRFCHTATTSTSA